MGRASVRRLLATGAAAALVLFLAGCGSYTETSPASGVDELVIPTPSPDPNDFVTAIDNPWLPLGLGARWTYRAGSQEVTVSTGEGPTIAGVATTEVTTDGVGSAPMVDFYAEDADGNVWWFGREGEWRAGDDGAQAGIAMLAQPRLGDGYAEMGEGGRAGQRSVITGLSTESSDELVIETTSALGEVTINHYQRGTGLVLRTEAEIELGLVAHDEPPT